MKQTIPRMAAAALTLGGTASGCGGDDSRPTTIDGATRDFCETVVSCFGGGSAYVETCVDNYYDAYVPSYVTDECRTSLVQFLNCFSANFQCPDGINFEACSDIAYEASYACDFYY